MNSSSSEMNSSNRKLDTTNNSQVVNVNRVVKYEYGGGQQVVNEDEIDDDLDVQVSGRAPPLQDDQVDCSRQQPPKAATSSSDVVELKKTELKSGKNKSRFYMEPADDVMVSKEPGVAFKNGYVFPNEEKLCDLSRVYCLNSLAYFSTVDAQTKPNSSGKLPDPIDQEGRLELTNYFLRFMPSNQISDCFKMDKEHQMFEIGRGEFVIPLMHIIEIRGVGGSSDKLKKLSIPSEVMVNVPKELYIKCKNFSTKYFVLASSEKSISQFTQHLLTNFNSYQLRSNRFQSLLEQVNYGTNRSSPAKSGGLVGLKKSFLKSKDLRQELEDCRCSDFMSVRSAPLKIQVFNYQEFIINPNMTFYALPKDVEKILLASRVVINENYVQEFASVNSATTDSRQSMYPGSAASSSSSSKKPNRFSEFLNSSKSGTLSNKQSAQITSVSSNQPPSTPVKATKSSTNPFFDNRFPVWTFTNICTGCHLIVVPEALPNKQDQCDIIIKNYNAFLCDELVKIKMKAAGVKVEKLLNVKRVEGEDYGEYEFFKFKVPFNYEKVQVHYYRLMQMCSYKTSLELNKEAETTSFYSNLHGTKWLKNVSVLISMAAKMVACLHLHQRNVFIEEDRANNDISCVLTSLVRLLFDAKCRTIAGFENLIHKEWFLAGHKFYDRLLTTLPLARQDADADQDPNDDTTSSSSAAKKSIAPVFLLFLDCVFQLTMQYPSEFEFNEYYLIHLWDYALSGMSYTFSYNGQNDWLSSLSKLTSEPANFDENLLGALFEANNEFWHRHLERTLPLIVNKNYQQNELILNPCDKIYVLKFWSRCYLRWYDIRHAYSSSSGPILSDRVQTPAMPERTLPEGIPTFDEEEEGEEEDRFEDCSDRKLSSSSNNSEDNPPAYKPPPPPPAPPSQLQQEPAEHRQMMDALPILRINIMPGVTRVKSNGDIQTNL